MKKIITAVLLMLAFSASAQVTTKLNMKALHIILGQCEDCEIISQDLIMIKKGEKVGVVNYNGDIIIPFHDKISQRNDSLFLVGDNHFYYDLWGIMDKYGKILLPIKYRDIREMKDGMIRVMDENGKFGFLNSKFELTIPCSFLNASDFCNGYAEVSDSYEKDNFEIMHSGIDYYLYNDWTGLVPKVINKEGKQVDNLKYIRPAGYQYKYLGHANGYDVKITDSRGNTKVKNFFRLTEHEEDNVLSVGTSQNSGFVRNNGLFIPCIYDYNSTIFIGDSVFTVVRLNKKYGVIDKTGKQIVDCKYDDFNILDNFFRFKINGKWGILNKQGKQILPAIFDWIEKPLGKKLFCVKKDGKYRFLDKLGKTLFETTNRYHEIRGGHYVVSKDGMYYAIDENGKIAFKSKNAKYPINHSYYEVYDDEGMNVGVLSKEGKIILPFEFDSYIKYTHGYFVLKKAGKPGIADINGRTTFDIK